VLIRFFNVLASFVWSLGTTIACFAVLVVIRRLLSLGGTHVVKQNGLRAKELCSPEEWLFRAGDLTWFDMQLLKLKTKTDGQTDGADDRRVAAHWQLLVFNSIV